MSRTRTDAFGAGAWRPRGPAKPNNRAFPRGGLQRLGDRTTPSRRPSPAAGLTRPRRRWPVPAVRDHRGSPAPAHSRRPWSNPSTCRSADRHRPRPPEGDWPDGDDGDQRDLAPMVLVAMAPGSPASYGRDNPPGVQRQYRREGGPLRGTAPAEQADHLVRERQQQRCVDAIRIPVGNRTRVDTTLARLSPPTRSQPIRREVHAEFPTTGRSLVRAAQ